MARITVEDCIDKVEGPYDLVLIAKERAAQLNSGVQPNVDPENDKNTVIALKEIAENKVSVKDLKESAINKLRKHIEQDTGVLDQDESEGDDFENIYKGEASKSGAPILPSKRARRIPEKIEVFKKEKIQKEILKDESLPDDNEISLEELKDQEEIEEASKEPGNLETSENE
jgi:DNA-directed RNA polymerase subunit omega|tara:strand:+ start:52 stop:567 length:516 start_codon:yes stop_codon:yes gene_type:complete